MKCSKTAQIKGNRVVGYIRVSDESQVDGYSLEAQKSEIIRWCERNGYELVGFYADEGVSAFTDNLEKRPQLKKLLEDAKKNSFDIVVVHTLDRWARDVGIQRHALRILGDYQVGFASVTEDFDYSTPNGRFLLTVIGGVSELYSGQLGLHVKKAQSQMAEMGIVVGPVPFGYQRQEKGLPPLIVDSEARILKEVFRFRTDGQSYGSIAIWLNDQCFRTREGNPFTAHSIKDILNNRFYCGYVKYKGKEYKGQHEAIISEDLFQRVQARRQRKEVIRSVHGPTGLLQGIVACVHCGNGLQSDRHRQKVPLYRERHAHNCPTNNTSTVAGVIDKQVATIVHSLELKPDWRKKMAEIAVDNYHGPSLDTLQEKRRRLGKAYADGAFTDQEYSLRLAEIDSQIQQATNITTPQLDEAVALFSDIPMLWNEATQDERRTIINSLIEMAYIDLSKKQVTAILPTLAFRYLFGRGIDVGANTPIELRVAEDKTEDVGDGGDGGAPRLYNSKALLSSTQTKSISISAPNLTSESFYLPSAVFHVVWRWPWY